MWFVGAQMCGATAAARKDLLQWRICDAVARGGGGCEYINIKYTVIVMLKMKNRGASAATLEDHHVTRLLKCMLLFKVYLLKGKSHEIGKACK